METKPTLDQNIKDFQRTIAIYLEWFNNHANLTAQENLVICNVFAVAGYVLDLTIENKLKGAK